MRKIGTMNIVQVYEQEDFRPQNCDFFFTFLYIILFLFFYIDKHGYTNFGFSHHLYIVQVYEQEDIRPPNLNIFLLQVCNRQNLHIQT